MNTYKDRSDPDIERKLSVLEKVPARDHDAAARGRVNFLAEARTLTLPVQHSESSRNGWFGALLAAFGGKRRSHTLAVFASIALVLAILLGGTSGTVYAAQGSMPGQVLYSVKLLSEDLRLVLTSSPQAELELTLDLVDRRLAEIDFLVEAGDDVPDAVVNRMEVHLDQALTIAVAIEDDGDDPVKPHIWKRPNDQDKGRTRWVDEDKEFEEAEEQVCRDTEESCVAGSEGKPNEQPGNSGAGGPGKGSDDANDPYDPYDPYDPGQPPADPPGYGPQPDEPPANAYGPGPGGQCDPLPCLGPYGPTYGPDEQPVTPPNSSYGPGEGVPNPDPPSGDSGDSGDSSGDGSEDSSGDSGSGSSGEDNKAP